MSATRLLRAADRTARPWKNGGGVTRDVAVFPEGADDKGFLWRASVATIAAAGPFSAYPGIDRLLIPLRGELVVKLGAAVHRLRPGSTALSFAGEDTVSAAPVGDACSILNIMTRRGACSVRLGRWLAARPTAAELLLFAAEFTGIAVDGHVVDLSENDALFIDRPAHMSLSLDKPVIAAEIFRQFVQ